MPPQQQQQHRRLSESSQVSRKKPRLPEHIYKYLLSIASAAIELSSNICLVGPAGSGKTKIINRIYNTLNEQSNTSIVIKKLTGQDVERLRLKLNINNAKTMEMSSGIGKDQQVVSIDDIINTNVLIIDDFSMMNVELFEWIDELLQEKHENSKAFGGIKLIMAGDPYLLAPVKGSPCFRSRVWKKCGFVIHEINDSIRHYGCLWWFDILKRVRCGQANAKDIIEINRLHKTQQDLENQLKTDHENNQHFQHLFGHKNNVKTYNLKKLNCINSDQHILEAIDQVTPHVSSTIKEVKKILDNIIDEKITIKVGASVIITRDQNNISSGTTGKITRIHQSFLMIDVGQKHQCQLFRCLFKNKITTKSGIKVLAKRYQFPVQLNYTMTIHNAQGMEFISPVIHSDDFWLPAQFYSALSRGYIPDNIIIASNNDQIESNFVNKYSTHGDYFYRHVMK